MKRPPKSLVIALTLTLLMSVIFLAYAFDMSPLTHSLPKKTVHVGSVSVRVEVANTDESRRAGLSGRAGLANGTGMLFVFDEAKHWRFWMKDMQFPIDIIWIGEAGSVVGIYDSVAPESYPQSFSSPEPALYVLEVPAGFAAKRGIAVGDKLILE